MSRQPSASWRSARAKRRSSTRQVGTVGQAPGEHVLQRGQPADQVELLEDQRDVAAGRAQLAPGSRADVASVDEHRAAHRAA